MISQGVRVVPPVAGAGTDGFDVNTDLIACFRWTGCYPGSARRSTRPPVDSAHVAHPRMKDLAAAYTRWRRTAVGHITEQVERDLMFALAGPLARRRVLDVGTGDGAYAIEAAL